MKKPIQFGKYWLLDRVNVGGMAEVWKAKAFGVEGFERLLAVKRILPNIAEDEEFITMFIDEAKIAVQLNHANVAQIFDLGKVDDSYFIALEFVHGKDVRGIFDRVKQKPIDGMQAMPIAQAAFIVMKACEGLDYAHNKKDAQGREIQLVHRDVSPQNILISYEGEVKLIDFGIAKAAGKASKTQQGILKGKFGYMSPEQVRGLPLDRRSDIFSLGIVLYELLTGERLFVGESDFSTLEKVRNVEILPPSTYNRRISEELERICMKALAKDVDDRYQNAIDLHDDLQAFMYTAGEFYSRKDLAAWMKKVFAADIEAESAKLEQYRTMPVPPAQPIVQQPMPGVSAQPTDGRPRRSTIPPPPPVPARISGAHPVVQPQSPSGRISGQHPVVSAAPQNGAASHAPSKNELGWDEEELATNIYSGPQDAEDSVVDNRPDLSQVSLNPDGEPVPHASVATQLPLPPDELGVEIPDADADDPLRRSNGAARKRNPFDYVLPENHSAPPIAASLTETPAFSAPPRRPLRSSTLLIGGGLAVLALVLLIGTGLVYFNSRPGTLFIASEPATNVQILLDNKRQPVDGTPATLKLEPGSYVLTVQREGYVPFNEQIEIKPGDNERRNITLEPLASGTGFTLVSEPAGAQALLDGHALDGVTPLKVQSVMPGKHKIEVKSPSGAWSQEVTIDAGKMIELHAALGPALAAAPIAPPTPVKPVAMKTVKDEPVAAVKKPEPTVEKQAKLPPPPSDKPKAVAAADKPKAAAPTEKKTAPVASLDDKPKTKKTTSTPSLDLPDEKPAPKKVASAEKQPDKLTQPVEKAAPSGGGDGYLRLGSKPWTNILVDGKETGLHTPQTHLKLLAGAHRITLTNAQFNIKETFSVDIKAGETETVIKDLRAQGADDSD